MEQGHNTGESVKSVIKSKINKMFAVTLAEIEKQTKDFNVDSTFFTKTSNNGVGYGMVRKKLLDSGNEVMKLIELIVDKVEITPKDSIIKIENVQN